MQAMQKAAEMPAMVMMPKAALEEITAGIDELKALIRGKAMQEAQSQWIESEDARKLLGISPKTWQEYRNARLLPFSQFGRKIYVQKSALDAFLESHLVGKQ